MSEEKRAQLWDWHAQCIARADAAKARRAMKEWEAWSQAAAGVLEQLA